MTRQRLFAVLLLGWQAYLIWACHGAWLLPLLACVAALIGGWGRLQVDPTRWGWRAILLVVALLASMRGWLLSLPETGASWSVAAAEGLMLIQALELFRRKPQGLLGKNYLGWGVAASFLIFVGAAGIGSATLLWGAIGVAVLAALLADAGRDAGSQPQPSALATRRILIAGVVLAVAWGTWQLSGQCAAGVRELRSWLSGRFALARTEEKFVVGYPQIATLRSITNEKVSNSTQVALRVEAERMPGYLRGRAYSYYDGSRWRVGMRRGQRWQRRLSPLNSPPDGLPFPAQGRRLFELQRKQTSRMARLEITNDPLRGRVYFLPLTTTHVQGKGTFLAVDEHNSVHRGLDTKEPYVAYFEEGGSSRQLAVEERQTLLSVFERLDPRVQLLATEIGAEKQSFAERVDAVESYFKTNYEYSMDGFPLPRRTDPLSHFLLERPAAHCEYFASGAVTLLRLLDIPCRYATGYVVTELEADEQVHWLARNHDAHAWAEAFDEENQRWVIVEATPGMEVPDTSSEQDDELLATDSETNTEVNAGLGRTAFETLGVQYVLDLLSTMLRSPFGLALAVVCFCLLLPAGFQLRRVAAASDDRVDKARRTLRRISRELRRRRLVREPTETLHAFARRLERAAPEDPRLQEAARWHEQYALLLYGGTPEPSALQWPPSSPH